MDRVVDAQQPQQPPGTKLPGFVSAGVIQQGEQQQPDADAAAAAAAAAGITPP
jgi:hypothetical protein